MNEITKKQIRELAFTDSEREEIDLARSKPISFDEDCPETTPERAKKFRRVNPPRHRLGIEVS